MIQKIRVLYENNKVWLFLIKYLLFSFLLTILVVLIDTGILVVQPFLPRFLLTGVDLAKTILGTLAGALLTITTFTFSTIMVVLTMYSSNFSPRVVDNFLTDKVSMKVLGIFVGGFFYCITTLLFMRSGLEDRYVLSATIAVIYSVACIIYFIRFVFSVSSSIQATKLIHRLFLQSMDLIEDTLAFRKKYEGTSTLPDTPDQNTYVVHASEFGYLELIDFSAMLDLMSTVNCNIVIHPCIGTFVTKNMDLFSVYYHQQEDLPKNFDHKLEKCFTLVDEKMTISDYKFSIQKIVEIALRAISPGINDPNTAIHCIRFIGVLLSRISESADTYSILQRNENPGRILYEDFQFKNTLYETYIQIIHYGKQDPSVVAALFESFKSILRCSSPSNVKTILDFAQYLDDQIREYHVHPNDRKILDEHLYDLQVLANANT